MQTPIERLKQLSADLVSGLRESGPEQLAAYMQERDRIFEVLMQGNLAPEEKGGAKQILEMDKQIMTRMNALKEEAASELVRIQQGRKSKSIYDNDSYGGYQEESLFFDRRR